LKKIKLVIVGFAVFMLLGGCNSAGGGDLPLENLPPYPVVAGDPVTDPVERGGSITLAVGESYQLAIDVDEDGLKDPNGDAVIFLSDMSDAMKDYFNLNEITGELTLTESLGGTFTIEFWSAETGTSDLLTTEDDPFSLKITTGGGT